MGGPHGASVSDGSPEYLGDGCYVTVEHGAIVLTTGNGLVMTNRIVLEPEVLGNFQEYIEALRRKVDSCPKGQ